MARRVPDYSLEGKVRFAQVESDEVDVPSDVPGQSNPPMQLVVQSWASPNAADVDVLMAEETVPTLGGIYDVADGLGGVPQALIVTVGGVAADVKAVNIAVVGTDGADAPLSENFLLTVNTVGIVRGTSLFKTVTSVTSPAQDGAGVTLKVGTYADDDCVMKEATIPAAGIVAKIGAIDGQPDEPRSVTLTLGGTAGSINGGTITVYGTDITGAALTEAYTAVEDTPGTLAGTKAFKSISRVFVHAQDGTGVTLTVGQGDLLGLNTKLSINTVQWATLGGVKESTAPTVTVSSTVLALNTIDLNSALNNTAVTAAYFV